MATIVRRHGYLRFAAACAVALGTVVATGSDASAGGSGTEVWTARYSGPDGVGAHGARRVVTSPDGRTVFVTGSSEQDYATIAYRVSTGASTWTSRYDGPGHGTDRPDAMAVSPDGTMVFVTGTSVGTSGRSDYATVAYDAATGGLLWVRRYDGPGTRRHGNDTATSLAVSPDGSTVFVTGRSAGAMTHSDYATIAYDSSTGRRRWSQRLDGPEGDYDGANALAVSPDGRAVFVTGYVNDYKFYGEDYGTAAYDAVTGAVIWTAFFDSRTDHEPGDFATALAVSPDATTVFVTGSTTSAYATLAYDTATGARIWKAIYETGGFATPTALAVGPDGTTVFVTGHANRWRRRTPETFAFATFAYDAATGARVWEQHFAGPIDEGAHPSSLALSPDGMTVYVAGQATVSKSPYASDLALIAYEATTGAATWQRLYDGKAHSIDSATSVASTPDGSKVIATGIEFGEIVGNRRESSYVTIALTP